MVKHMIVWAFRPELEDKSAVAAQIKAALEGLVGKIEGLTEMHILISPMDCSSGDVMMDSTFTSPEALAAYQAHPLHQEIANSIVRPAMSQRLSFDYVV